jgi:hypothetical protein
VSASALVAIVKIAFFDNMSTSFFLFGTSSNTADRVQRSFFSVDVHRERLSRGKRIAVAIPFSERVDSFIAQGRLPSRSIG